MRKPSLFLQNFLYQASRHLASFMRHDVSLPVYEYAKRNADELELFRKEIPLVIGQVDVLALNVVVLHERLARIARRVLLIAYIKKTHRLVLEVFHNVTLVQHAAPAWTATYSPEIHEEDISFVLLHQSAEQGIALGRGGCFRPAPLSARNKLPVGIDSTVGHNLVGKLRNGTGEPLRQRVWNHAGGSILRIPHDFVQQTDLHHEVVVQP